MTTNGTIALVGVIVAVVASAALFRSHGGRRSLAAVVVILALFAVAYAALDGMGVFCQAPPGAACL